MMKNMRVAAAAMLLAACAGLSACGAVDSIRGMLPGGSAETAAGQSVGSAESYNTYVDLYNSMVSGSLSSRVSDYFDGVQEQEEFATLEDGRYISYGFSEYDYELLDKAQAQAEAGTGYEALDAAAAVLCPAAKQVMELLDSAAAYGKQQGYADDDYAKAREIHAEFYPALSQYYDRAGAFSGELLTVGEERRQAELQMLRDEGYTLRAGMMELLDTADEIMEKFYEQETISSENITELDLTEIRPLYDKLAEQTAQVLKDSEDQEEIEKEGFDPSFNRVSDFADDAAALKVSLQEIISRVEENDPLSEIELQMGDMTEGSLEKWMSSYNDLIDTYNRL